MGAPAVRAPIAVLLTSAAVSVVIRGVATNLKSSELPSSLGTSQLVTNARPRRAHPVGW
jgi:hypothetical protein